EPVEPDHIPLSSTKIPTRSAMEETVCTKRISVSELLNTLAIVCSIQRQLKTRSLKQTLRNLASFREKRTPQTSIPCPNEAHILEAAATFRSARLYVPIDTCCLLDSIA